MNVSNKATLLSELDKLVDLELYDSAETLATLYLSHLSTVEFKPRTTNEPISLVFADVYEHLADALYKNKEVKRALHYYKAASHRRRPQNSKYRSQGSMAAPEEARLRYKECKCLIDLNDAANVLALLEGIPYKLRDTKINLLLGNLLKQANRKKNAIGAYKDALLTAPHAIEIIEQLASLGVEAAEILATLDEAFRYKDAGALVADGWLHILVAGIVNKRNHEYEKSFGNFQKLSALYPKNPYLMMQQVDLCVETEQCEAGMVLYRQIRREDANLVRRTATTFGRLLYLKQDALELCRLTDDVLDAQAARPEGWVLAAMYAGLKSEIESAVALTEKAIQVDPAYTESYLFRGQLLLTQESHDVALIAFSQASALEKSVAAYAGLVKAQLGLGKNKEATACAREALAAYPRCSEAHILMGTVLAQNPSSAGESLSSFAKALQLNPLSKKAAAALAEGLLATGKAQEAVNCLESILKKVSDPKLRLTLGKAYAALGQYQASVEQIHTASSLTSLYSPVPTTGSAGAADAGAESAAAQELERVEGMMRGEAEEEEDEEGEGELDEEFDSQGEGRDAHSAGMVDAEGQTGFDFGAYSGHSLIDEDGTAYESAALAQYYHAAGGALEGDISNNSLNPRDFTAYADEGELELSYMQGEHSGVEDEEGEEEVDDGARFYGTLEDSRED